MKIKLIDMQAPLAYLLADAMGGFLADKFKVPGGAMIGAILIPNYGERWRYREPISTTFVESTINQVVSKSP